MKKRTLPSPDKLDERVARAVATVVRDPKTSKAAKTAAGLAMTQRPRTAEPATGGRALAGEDRR
jgi:hypothetical protein